MNDRIIPMEGVRNFRDFGGYDTTTGRRIKTGLLYRSGHYAEATTADLEALESLGIALQADLRRPDERERQIGRWPGDGVHVISNDGGRETDAPHTKFLQKVEADAEAADNWMNDYYIAAPYKAHHVELYTEWFDRLAGLDGSEAAVVNCAAGKDRTGIICALTKHVLGVAEADIVADYVLTNEAVDVDQNLPAAQAYFNEMLSKSYDADVYRPFMGVRERYLRTALKTIVDQSGSIDVYLRETLDVTDAKRAELTERLIDAA